MSKKLNQASIEKIEKIVADHKSEMGPVIVMLHDVQKALGYIPTEAMQMIADATNTSASEVFGVVTFYSQFTTEPKGRHVINVCMGTACYVKGSQAIVDKMKELTKSPLNGTSSDGLFSLDATRCLGACGLAPVVVIDDKVYGNANQNDDIFNTLKDLLRTEGLN